jgi:hypothetical protein
MLPEYIWFYIKSGWCVHIVNTLLQIVNFCRPPTDLNRASSFVSSFVYATQRDMWGTRQCEKLSLGINGVQLSGGLPSERRGCPQSGGRHNHQETSM